MSSFLNLVEVLTIHYDQIERYGGSHGIRDPGQLEAALFRPQSGYYEDTIAEAAALWESLSQNHPFIDGNKRTSFACCLTFLRINGLELMSNEAKTIQFLLPLYESSSLTYEVLEPWLRENVVTKSVDK
ncbi:MAG: death-on-curing protein [Rhodomicrobium sp.]|nr:MAG: death-on-curing protein [Rhodomicrobium sp.]